MNLEYMKLSLFEISYKKNNFFRDIQVFLDAPVYIYTVYICIYIILYIYIYIYIYILYIYIYIYIYMIYVCISQPFYTMRTSEFPLV